MNAIRTILLILFTVVLVAFIAINWERVPVNIWPLEQGYLHLEWPVGLLVLVSILIGFLPTWLWSKAARWRMNRRISALENTILANTPTPPMATSTQLEAHSPEAPTA